MRTCAHILLFHSYALIKILVCCRPILLIQPIHAILLLKFQTFASLYYYYGYYLYHYLVSDSTRQGQPPRGAPGYQVLSDILFRFGLIPMGATWRLPLTRTVTYQIVV